MSRTVTRLFNTHAEAMAAGNRMGIRIREEDAIRWLTINPAKSIGVDKQAGSLEPGKMADVVVWSGNPFSVYSRAEKVYVVDDADIKGFLVAPKAEALQQLVEKTSPAAVLISSSPEGKEVAARLAIKTSSGLITDAVDVQPGDGGAGLVTTQSVFAEIIEWRKKVKIETE